MQIHPFTISLEPKRTLHWLDLLVLIPWVSSSWPGQELLLYANGCSTTQTHEQSYICSCRCTSPTVGILAWSPKKGATVSWLQWPKPKGWKAWTDLTSPHPYAWAVAVPQRHRTFQQRKQIAPHQIKNSLSAWLSLISSYPSRRPYKRRGAGPHRAMIMIHWFTHGIALQRRPFSEDLVRFLFVQMETSPRIAAMSSFGLPIVRFGFVKYSWSVLLNKKRVLFFDLVR